MGKGGNKRKKGKKILDFERELLFKTEMQEYGQILRLLGDSRLEIQCIDGVKRTGHIRGKIKKKIWMTTGDVVLVALREHEKEKCDVLIKYTEDEVRKLKALKEVPENIKIPEPDQNGVSNELGDEGFFGYEKDVIEDKKKNKKNDDFEDDDESDDDWLNNRMNHIRGKKMEEESDEEEEEEEKDKEDEEEEEEDETEEEAIEKERLRKLEIDERKKAEREKKEKEAKDKEILKEIEKNKKNKDVKPQKSKASQKEDKKDKINIDDI
jgi:translation initiation factor 1A